MSNIKMLSDYIQAVSKNVNIEKQQVIDLVISGGAFNGMFGIGSVMFIKQLEKDNKIKIDKISGCSAGAVLGILYITDSFELTDSIFQKLKCCLKENSNISCLREIVSETTDKLFKTDEDVRNTLNNRMFINYNDLSDCSSHCIKEYDSKQHLIDCIVRSMFVPFLIDGNLKVENRYIDGIIPYVFKSTKNRVLYIELMKDHIDMLRCVVTQNEKNEHYRILQGVTDAASFFTEGNSTRLSWYDNWSIIQITKNNIFYLSLMVTMVIFDYLSSLNVPDIVNSNKFYKLVTTFLNKIMLDIISKLHD